MNGEADKGNRPPPLVVVIGLVLASLVTVLLGPHASDVLRDLSPDEPTLMMVMGYLLALLIGVVVMAIVVSIFRHGSLRGWMASERAAIGDIKERGLKAHLADHDVDVPRPSDGSSSDPRRRVRHHGVSFLVTTLLTGGLGVVAWATVADESEYTISPLVLLVCASIALYHLVQTVRFFVKR